jgi:hypothetical protein
MGFDDEDDLRDPELTTEQRTEIEACRRSFLYFLKYYQFTNRETGEINSFRELWPGQLDFAVAIQEHPWILALKAGKLGFTELECAYDVWIARFGQANARVHLFSRDIQAAQTLLEYVRFGFLHLPSWMQLRIRVEEAGGDTMRSLKLDGGRDDVRTIISYSAGPHVGIDQTATHSHVDEMARMPFPDRTWSAIQSTVAPSGSCHIVTRGAGDEDFLSQLWEAAEAGIGLLHPFFAPWSARPDRSMEWRTQQSSTMPNQQFLHFAPETPAEALAGDATAEYIPAQIWDACADTSLPTVGPGDRTPIVLGVDGAVTGDNFAIVAVSRHPDRPQDAAIRACKVWDPKVTGVVDFDAVERFILFAIEGGCNQGHPPSMPLPGCPACRAGAFTVLKMNIVSVVYDPYQIEQMMQHLRHHAWCDAFPQAREREIADSLMHKLALRRQLSHNGDARLREHVLNVRAKLSKEQDSKMRMIKRSPNRKIDLAVAASMAIFQCLYLNL